MNPTLLIAEGDAELCDVYRRFLNRHGYSVDVAGNGLECVAKLRQTAPAVLVLDRDLCWGGGDGVLAWMREQHPTAVASVILTVPAGCQQEIAHLIGPPVVRFMPKPFSLTALLESIRLVAALEQRKPAAPSTRCLLG